METLGDTLRAKKGTNKYVCIECDFTCCKKYSWERHLNTAKHKMMTLGDNLSAFEGKKGQFNNYKCDYCNKTYQYRQCLWRHFQLCKEYVNNSNNSNNNNYINSNNSNNNYINNNNNYNNNTQLVELLIKENKEIKELILEIVKNGTNITTNHNHTNSHNKAFNLQFFLNETCKNAMNITEFVDSIKLQLSDFISVGELGFVEGISKIIVNNLNLLDETTRPIHCTDQKRETYYIKDDNIWQKEDEHKKKLHKLVKSVAYKNELLMKTYKETYPDYNNPESKRSNIYSNTVIEAMNSEENSREKIIKQISKHIIISSKKN